MFLACRPLGFNSYCPRLDACGSCPTISLINLEGHDKLSRLVHLHFSHCLWRASTDLLLSDTQSLVMLWGCVIEAGTSRHRVCPLAVPVQRDRGGQDLQMCIQMYEVGASLSAHSPGRQRSLTNLAE